MNAAEIDEWHQMRRQVWWQMWDPMQAQVRTSVWNQVWNQVGELVRRRVWVQARMEAG